MNMVTSNLYIPQYSSFHESCTLTLCLFYVVAYYAQVAGLHYGVSLSDNGFEVSFAFTSYIPHASACRLR